MTVAQFVGDSGYDVLGVGTADFFVSAPEAHWCAVRQRAPPCG